MSCSKALRMLVYDLRAVQDWVLWQSAERVAEIVHSLLNFELSSRTMKM